MDPRLEAILAEELGSGLPGLAGSDARLTIRAGDALVTRIVAATLPRDGVVRDVTVHAKAGNTFDAIVTLSKPAFLPPLHAHLTIERQPAFPDSPVLVLRLTGGAGNLLKMAGPLLGGSMPLPPGVRLEQDLVFVDLRTLAAQHGQSSHLRYVRELLVSTEEHAIVLKMIAAVPLRS